MSPGIPQIQDSGTDSRPQTVGQSRTSDNQRCSGVAHEHPTCRHCLTSDVCEFMDYLAPVAQC